MAAGYSGTPLAKKLTLKDGFRVWFDAMPDSIRTEIDEYGLKLIECAPSDAPLNAAHIFVTTASELSAKLGALRAQIEPDGQVWVSWPKKASKVPTDIAQADVQEAGFAIGFVDTKKCAVDETWSGLKFVIRKELR
ncbi:DUF3052 family protein [Pontixanthobacter sp. CEM42]|uniref:DUF3052 family protein n=1 Tax=Pontixanthobacter sp. CEM42 TaxID=2792077 RepID=UPI001AE0A692|nr:DUF3052 family protein [Pontixanthobacter sp. CEM42]